MSDTVRKIFNLRYDRFEKAEIKLQKLAEKGLVLEKCGLFFWTFRKEEHKKLKYAIVFFSEYSEFDPEISDNQQTYFDYAKAAGWDFVTQINQIQIFCTDAENPVPFETDEKEKFKNIKAGMKKMFLISTVVLIAVFSLNLAVLFNSFLQNPIDFLSNSNQQLMASFLMVVVVIYEIYSLLNYLYWCKRSEKSIASGGLCVKRGNINEIIEIAISVFIILGVALYFINIANQMNLLGVLLIALQTPILIFVFRFLIKALKKKKASATLNKVISFMVLFGVSIAYLAIAALVTIRVGLNTTDQQAYRTVNWKLSETEYHEYRLYSDEIPLTCEDLYGETGYEYYSYESDFSSSVFLSKNSYRQNSLPAYDSPPWLEYEILETRLSFVYELVKQKLLEIPQWLENRSYHKVDDDDVFSSNEAYQRYYDETQTGEYVLFFENKIIVLKVSEPLNAMQISVVREKLGV